MKIIWLLSTVIGLALASCQSTPLGTMLPGTIYSQDGKIMRFAIEKAINSGKVIALDTESGETFEGTYVGIRETVSGHSSATIVSNAGYASGFGTAAVSSNVANASAYLRGDRATMLNCVIDIQVGANPHGLGGCNDNRGQLYRLQF